MFMLFRFISGFNIGFEILWRGKHEKFVGSGLVVSLGIVELTFIIGVLYG